MEKPVATDECGGEIPSTRLTPKQTLFVAEYLVDLNATQAAVRAGYSRRSARQVAAQNMSKPVIRAAIASAQAERARRTEITSDRVLQRLGLIAFGDLRQLFSSAGELRRPEEWPDEVVAMLTGVDVATVQKGEGAVEYVARIRTADKLKALEMLGRHLGMWKDTPEASARFDLAERIREGRRRVQQLRAKEQRDAAAQSDLPRLPA